MQLFNGISQDAYKALKQIGAQVWIVPTEEGTHQYAVFFPLGTEVHKSGVCINIVTEGINEPSVTFFYQPHIQHLYKDQQS